MQTFVVSLVIEIACVAEAPPKIVQVTLAVNIFPDVVLSEDT